MGISRNQEPQFVRCSPVVQKTSQSCTSPQPGTGWQTAKPRAKAHPGPRCGAARRRIKATVHHRSNHPSRNHGRSDSSSQSSSNSSSHSSSHSRSCNNKCNASSSTSIRKSIAIIIMKILRTMNMEVLTIFTSVSEVMVTAMA